MAIIWPQDERGADDVYDGRGESDESLDALSKKLAKSYRETAKLSLEVEIAEIGKALGHNNFLLDVSKPLRGRNNCFPVVM